MYSICIRANLLHSSVVNCCVCKALHSMECCMTKSKSNTNASVSTFSFRTLVSFKMVPANERVDDNIV